MKSCKEAWWMHGPKWEIYVCVWWITCREKHHLPHPPSYEYSLPFASSVFDELWSNLDAVAPDRILTSLVGIIYFFSLLSATHLELSSCERNPKVTFSGEKGGLEGKFQDGFLGSSIDQIPCSWRIKVYIGMPQIGFQGCPFVVKGKSTIHLKNARKAPQWTIFKRNLFARPDLRESPFLLASINRQKKNSDSERAKEGLIARLKMMNKWVQYPTAKVGAKSLTGPTGV